MQIYQIMYMNRNDFESTIAFNALQSDRVRKL